VEVTVAFRIIPGETPIDDISGLKIKGITRRPQLNLLEAENILKPTMKYFYEGPSKKTAPFDFAWTVQLHGEMFGDVWQWAGKIRTKAVNLGVDPTQIEPQLYELMKALPLWQDMPLVRQAAMLHHKAVSIHPFLNGNGRWSRMLANIWIARNGGLPTKWPEDIIGTVSPIREEYLQTLKAADQGEYDPLVELHTRFTPTEEE
jgi:Fic-DOC domain mobile mystery protein B